MSESRLQRALRGGCQCGRNSYIIDVPHGTTERAQVLFHTDSMHKRPQAEADYIHLTLASLRGEDLRDLEDLGLIPEFEEAEEAEEQPAIPTTTTVVGRDTRGVPWFESMIEGTRLGSLRHSQVVDHSRDGAIRVEWEIVEWTDSDDLPEVAPAAAGDVDMMTNNATKRKMGDRDDADDAVEAMQ
ncbi:hypothetical protein CTA1_8027 [Colletotrichum tanaceti]|uniref:Uncharacterized protein n=1 Tax=Colletotrichum tanaceti TaxID=1306861 RepID=A0A4U6XMM6_9PEZI|nr:hypothetical protein CTA1_8027 [Colletotrichum tanaceti]